MKELYIFLGFLAFGLHLRLNSAEPLFKLHTPSFQDKGMIPLKQACERYGENRSPEFQWSSAPANTATFALVCNDPDAPGGNFIHWVYFNIPATVDFLSEGLGRSAQFSDGSRQGTNSFERIGYDGPCPPPGPAHHYIFTLYALDTELHLKSGADYNDLQKAMKGHILGQTKVTGLFKSK